VTHFSIPIRRVLPHDNAKTIDGHVWNLRDPVVFKSARQPVDRTQDRSRIGEMPATPPQKYTAPSSAARKEVRRLSFSVSRTFAVSVLTLALGAAAPYPARAANGDADAAAAPRAPDAEAAPPTPAPAADVAPAAAPSLPELPESAASPAPDGAPRAEGTDGLDGLDLANLLENVVVSATKSAVREDEAPAITTVINRDEIRRWGYQSVAEVLRHVAGFYVIDDHIIPNVGIRGVSGGLRSESGLIKVMINGRSVAFRSSAGNWLGAELIPLSAIQQIEIIRGPASSLYGADAFLGIINIVTRRPEVMDGGELSVNGLLHQNNFGSGLDMAAGTMVGPWEVMLSFRDLNEDRSGLRLPGSSPAPALPPYAPADLKARQLVQTSRVALGTLSYHFGQRATATLTGYYSGIDRGAEFADWQQLTHNLDFSGRNAGTDVSLRQGFANLGLTFAATPKLDLSLNVMAFAGGPTGRDRIEVGSEFYYVKREFGYRGMEIEVEGNWRPHPALSILTGAGVIADRQKLPLIYHVLKSSFGTNRAGDTQLVSGEVGDVNLWNPGARVLAIWKPVQRFTVTSGLRYDYHNIYKGQWSARLGGVVSLAPNLHFKLLYGSAFKAPSPQLLYGTPITVGDISGNRLLRPSFVNTVETQFSYRPAPFAQLTTGVAFSDLRDQAEFSRVGLNQVAQNISGVRSLSWETELKLDYRRILAAYANVSINRTWRRLDQPGYVASLTHYDNIAFPAMVANAGASALLPWLPLRLSVEGSFVTARPSSPTNTLEIGREYFLDPYFLLGATLSTVGIQLLPSGETVLSLTARNLLDTRVVDPGFAGIDYPQLRRVVMLQLRQEF
jgi:iron complex outermembrane receptor protein